MQYEAGDCLVRTECEMLIRPTPTAVFVPLFNLTAGDTNVGIRLNTVEPYVVGFHGNADSASGNQFTADSSKIQYNA